MPSMNIAFPKGDFGGDVILQLIILCIISGSLSYQGRWTRTNQRVFFFDPFPLKEFNRNIISL